MESATSSINRRPSAPIDAVNFDELAPILARGFHDDEALTVDYEVEHSGTNRATGHSRRFGSQLTSADSVSYGDEWRGLASRILST